MKEKEINEIINMLDENQAKMIKEEKKQQRKELICNIIWILALVSVVLILINVIDLETRKAVKKCIENGYSENYCIRVSR